MSLLQLLASIGLPLLRPDPQALFATDLALDWDQVAPSWWCRVTGQYEIHVKLDDDLGWEIACHEDGQPTSRPVFRKDLIQAFEIASNLYSQYDRLVQSSRNLN